MSQPSAPRPAQVTFAGWLTIGASVLAVAMAFAEVSRIGSTDTQEAINRFLAQDPGRSLGITLADAQAVLRVTSTAAAAHAAATAVLGWYVLRRSKGSRLALTVLALPLLVTGLFSGGFATAIVAASATMLWLQPARTWFAGDATGSSAGPAPGSTAGSTAPAGRVAPVVGPVSDPVSSPPSAPVPPYPPGVSSNPYQSSYDPSYGTLPTGLEAEVRRPAAVTWACVLTWVFTVAITGLLVVTALLLAAEPDRLLDAAYRQNPDLADQGISRATIQATVYGLTAVVILWSLVAAACAVLAFRRVRWGMIALLASALVAGGLSLLLAIGSVLTLVVVVACAVTIALLLRPEVRQWYAAPR